jgi:hypothetical protein
VDEHAYRVTHPLRDTWANSKAGQATLLDLSRTTEQAATLDHANADLLGVLRSAWGDLEYAYFTHEREEHLAVGTQIMRPVLAAMDEE